MKWSPMLSAAVLMVGLIPCGFTQTTAPASPTDSSSQTKQEKKAQKAKAKADKGSAQAQSGKKTTTSQDAAYALAARKGVPDHETTPPK